MERAELILLIVIWWGALSLLSVYGIVRTVLGVDKVEELPRQRTPAEIAEVAELEREWQQHLQELARVQQPPPRITRILEVALVVATWFLIAAVVMTCWPLCIGAWAAAAFDRWWSPQPLARNVRRVANMKVPGLSWLDDMHGRPR